MFPKSDGVFLLALLLLLTSLQCATTYPQPNVNDIQPGVAYRVNAGTPIALTALSSDKIEPETVYVANGTSAHLRCTVESNVEQDTVHWFKSGIRLAVSSDYIIDPATPSDQGLYTCVVHLRSGRTLQANLNVNVFSPPTVSFDSDKIMVNVNDKLTIRCRVSPKLLTGRIYWQRPGNDSIINEDAETLVIDSVVPQDAGVYICKCETKIHGTTFNSSASVLVEVNESPISNQIVINGGKKIPEWVFTVLTIVGSVAIVVIVVAVSAIVYWRKTKMMSWTVDETGNRGMRNVRLIFSEPWTDEKIKQALVA